MHSQVTKAHRIEPNMLIDVLLDSGASDHFVHNLLLLNVEEHLVEYRKLHPSKIIEVAGYNTVQGIATGISRGFAMNSKNELQPISLQVTLVPGLGKHLFSPEMALKRGVTTVLSKENPRLSNASMVIPLKHVTPRVFAITFMIPKNYCYKEFRQLNSQDIK